MRVGTYSFFGDAIQVDGPGLHNSVRSLGDMGTARGRRLSLMTIVSQVRPRFRTCQSLMAMTCSTPYVGRG